MAFWILFAFLLGLAVGVGTTWWLFGGPPIPSSAATPSRLPVEEADEVPDSMSLTAKRLVSDLERKYEGAVAGGDCPWLVAFAMSLVGKMHASLQRPHDTQVSSRMKRAPVRGSTCSASTGQT